MHDLRISVTMITVLPRCYTPLTVTCACSCVEESCIRVSIINAYIYIVARGTVTVLATIFASSRTWPTTPPPFSIATACMSIEEVLFCCTTELFVDLGACTCSMQTAIHNANAGGGGGGGGGLVQGFRAWHPPHCSK